MTNKITRMWINQPSSLQAHHDLHGTNVLAEHEYGDTMRIHFLSQDATATGTISQQISRNALSEGWRPQPIAIDRTDVLEVVTGLHKALSRMVDKHDPDSIEAEWLSHSNELVRKMTGNDVSPLAQIDVPRPKP